MKVAIAQLNPTSGDIAGNERRILAALESAQARGADLLVAPEMAVPGYCIGDQIEELDFLAANRAAVDRLAARTSGVAAVIGFVDYDPGQRNEDGRVRKYNAAAVAQHGRIVGIARKSLLPSYRYFDDKRYFTPAATRAPIAIRLGGEAHRHRSEPRARQSRARARDAQARDVRLGVSICEDMWDSAYRVKPIADLVKRGADVVLNINASPFSPAKRFERAGLIEAHIKRTGKAFVYVNTVGVGDNGKNVILFDGQSLAYDARGQLLHVGRQFEEECPVIDLTQRLREPLSPGLGPLDREREVYDGLVFGLREYARHCGFREAIVPVSGGVDSSLALAIAAAALGREHVAAFNLPSRFNTEQTKAIAARLCANFGVKYTIVPIHEIDELVTRTFERHAHPLERGTAKENIQARIRGLLMMAESNDTGRLLISCGNETEVALGYATLYGDMCGGLSLIGDLSKLDVYRVAKHVNRLHDREMIPEEVFRIDPSAELSEKQRDPFDYDVTAPIVGEMIEKRQSPADLLAAFERQALNPDRFRPDAAGRTVYEKHDAASFEKLVYETYSLMKKSVYKRLQGPPILVVSERAFGFDLRETIINGWTGRMR